MTKITFEDKIEGEIRYLIQWSNQLETKEPTREISDRIERLKGKILGLETALKIYNIPNEEEIALTKHLKGEL